MPDYQNDSNTYIPHNPHNVKKINNNLFFVRAAFKLFRPYNTYMPTNNDKGSKMKQTEFTANVAMSNAPTVKVGANFAKPIPRIVRENKKSFFAKFLKKV